MRKAAKGPKNLSTHFSASIGWEFSKQIPLASITLRAICRWAMEQHRVDDSNPKLAQVIEERLVR